MLIQVIIQNDQQLNDYFIEELCDRFDLKYGFSDMNYCLGDEKVSDFYTIYDPNQIGRGIEAYVEDHQLFLTIAIPVTPFEIELFYDLVRYVCNIFHKDCFYRNEESIHLDQIYDFIDEDQQKSIEYFLELEQNIDEIGFVYLYAVRHNLCLGKKEITNIRHSLDLFEQYLHELQKQDYIYATVTYLQNEDKKVIGSYPIKEDESFVIPLHPESFYDPGCEIDSFYFSPYYTFIPFNIFIENCTNYTYFDCNHIMVSFKKMELFDLIERYDTKLFEESESYGAYGRIIDSGFLHSEKIQDFHFDLDEDRGFIHIVIYLLWCYHHQLLDETMVKECNLDEVIANPNINFIHYFKNHPKMQGDLQENYFNELGKKFTNQYYVFLKKGYPNDVDQSALAILGKERYHCKEYKDEAYLFVSYDDYLEPLNKCIEQAFNEFIKNHS